MASKTGTTKVRVVIELDVDTKAWNSHYGQHETPAEIKATIDRWVRAEAERPFQSLRQTVFIGEQRPDGFQEYRMAPIVTVRSAR